MYCANCGVRLGDGEKSCPLCGTRAYHPDIPRTEGERLYPENNYREPRPSRLGFQIVFTFACFVALITVLLCDLRINGAVTWSGYVTGGVTIFYSILILPLWFKDPNPVIFAPCSFAAIALFLLYVCLTTGGGWFLPFALPVVGGFCAVVTALCALLRYVRRGKLYIIGGAFIGVGVMALVCELLMIFTFDNVKFVGWSIYPLAALSLIGGFLIFLAICRPAREAVERRFFF